jgi:hypothetical protein
MHRLHDILPLPIALNGETEERDEMEPERISLKGHLTGVSDICVVKKYVDHVRPRSARHLGGTNTHGGTLLFVIAEFFLLNFTLSL